MFSESAVSFFIVQKPDTARVFAASWSSSSCWSDDTISYRRKCASAMDSYKTYAENIGSF